MSDKAVHQANAVVHFDISGADDTALRRFYGDLLNWHVELKTWTCSGPHARRPGRVDRQVTKAQIKDPAGNVLTLIQK